MKTITTAILILVAFQAYSQTDNAETLLTQIKKLNGTIVLLKGENKTIKDSLKYALDQNLYFRETLKIFENKTHTVSADKLDFMFIGFTRKSGSNLVILEFLVINHDADKTILFTPGSFASAIDLQGNGYKPSDLKSGSQKYGSTLFKDIPLKLTITFSGINMSVKLLKLINLQFSTPSPVKFKKTEVTFKDISIQ